MRIRMLLKMGLLRTPKNYVAWITALTDCWFHHFSVNKELITTRGVTAC